MSYYKATNRVEKLQKILQLFRLFAVTRKNRKKVQSKMYSVFMVIPELDRLGGYEKQGLQLAGALAQSGNLVSIISDRTGNFPPREFRNGFLIHRLGGFKLLLFFRLIVFLASRRRTFQLMHVHGVTGFSVIAAWIGRMLGKPVCLKAATRDDLRNVFSSRGLKSRLYRRILKNIPNMIAVSEELGQEMQSCGIPPARITRIPNFVNSVKFTVPSPDRKQILRRKHGVSDSTVVFLCLCRLEKRKGVEFLLQAWKEYPGGVLWIVGGGPEEENLKELAEHLKLSQVVFFGTQLAPLDYYQAADVFVFPSTKEGFPNVLLEAMSCGLPCISSAIGGVTDLLLQDLQGLLVPPGDPLALSEAMRKAHSSPDRKRWSAGARMTVEENYDISRITAAYLNLYSRAVEGHIRPSQAGNES